MKTFPVPPGVSLCALFCLFLTSCSVDPRWSNPQLVRVATVPSLPIPKFPSFRKETSPQTSPVLPVAQNAPNGLAYVAASSSQEVVPDVLRMSPEQYQNAITPAGVRIDVEEELRQERTRQAHVQVSAPRVLRASSVRPSHAQANYQVALKSGKATVAPQAPAAVKRVVAAGNRLQSKPYKWGGGHAVLNDSGYDCSGAVSYALREAGLMADQRPSRGFFNYGDPGPGEWITVWVRDGHVFMTVGDIRLDTGGSSVRTGPRWKSKNRSYEGFVARHPRGL